MITFASSTHEHCFIFCHYVLSTPELKQSALFFARIKCFSWFTDYYYKPKFYGIFFCAFPEEWLSKCSFQTLQFIRIDMCLCVHDKMKMKNDDKKVPLKGSIFWCEIKNGIAVAEQQQYQPYTHNARVNDKFLNKFPSQQCSTATFLSVSLLIARNSHLYPHKLAHIEAHCVLHHQAPSPLNMYKYYLFIRNIFALFACHTLT